MKAGRSSRPDSILLSGWDKVESRSQTMCEKAVCSNRHQQQEENSLHRNSSHYLSNNNSNARKTDTPASAASSSRQGGSGPLSRAAGAVAPGWLGSRCVAACVGRGDHGAVPRGGLVVVVPVVDLSFGRGVLAPPCVMFCFVGQKGCKTERGGWDVAKKRRSVDVRTLLRGQRFVSLNLAGARSVR